MKSLFCVIMLISMAVGGQSQNITNDELAYASVKSGDPLVETGIKIYPTVVSDDLNIEVTDKLSGTKVTVSIFNSMGEIVFESILGIGLNKADVEGFGKGQYVAVVRENDVYASKSSFEVK